MRRTLTILTACLLALGLAGCGEDDLAEAPPAQSSDAGAREPSTETSPASAAEQNADDPAPPARLAITMGSPTEFAMVPETAVVSAGNVTLDVRNDGSIEHEVIVIRTDRDSGDLPRRDDGGAVEDGAVMPHGDTDHGQGMDHAGVHFATGTGGEVSLDLAPGKYAIVCNLPGHYASGMHASFEVR